MLFNQACKFGRNATSPTATSRRQTFKVVSGRACAPCSSDMGSYALSTALQCPTEHAGCKLTHHSCQDSRQCRSGASRDIQRCEDRSWLVDTEAAEYDLHAMMSTPRLAQPYILAPIPAQDLHYRSKLSCPVVAGAERVERSCFGWDCHNMRGSGRPLVGRPLCARCLALEPCHSCNAIYPASVT